MLVLDASAAMDIACATDKGMALREVILRGDVVASSSSLRLDLANGFARFIRMGAVSRDVTEKCLELALTLVDEHEPYENLIPEAFRNVRGNQISVSDLVYYALARQQTATLLTSNAAVAELCRATSVDCIDASEPLD